jgi:hypothetical protein
MEADRVDAIEELLAQAERAHGEYESTELNGVYDQQWPQWYAAYAVEHGIGAILGHDVTAEQLGTFLAGSYADFEQADPKPSDPWGRYIARRAAAEFRATT